MTQFTSQSASQSLHATWVICVDTAMSRRALMKTTLLEKAITVLIALILTFILFSDDDLASPRDTTMAALQHPRR